MLKELRLIPFHKGECLNGERWALEFLLPLKIKYHVYKIENGFADFYLKKKNGSLWYNLKKKNMIFVLKKVLNSDSAIKSAVKLVTSNTLLGGNNDLCVVTEINQLDPNHTIAQAFTVLDIKIIELKETEFLYEEKQAVKDILAEIKGVVQ
jgi:hypothetical protein